jgi:hypothetical protein
LGSLLERNLLVLEIQPPFSTDPQGGVPAAWGAISLVILPAGTDDPR